MAVCDSASVLIKILHKKTDISIAEYPFFLFNILRSGGLPLQPQLLLPQ